MPKPATQSELPGVLLVTGGSRGIGAATARLAATRGYAVCVNYFEQRQEAQVLVDAIREEGGQAVAVQADVASEAEVCGCLER